VIFNILVIRNYSLDTNIIFEEEKLAVKYQNTISKSDGKTFLCPIKEINKNNLYINVVMLRYGKIFKNKFYLEIKKQEAEKCFKKMITTYAPGHSFGEDILRIAIDRGYLFLNINTNDPIALYFSYPKIP